MISFNPTSFATDVYIVSVSIALSFCPSPAAIALLISQYKSAAVERKERVENFSLYAFKLFFICCPDIIPINLFLNDRKREDKPFLEKIDGCWLGGRNGLISCAGEDIYILCFSGMLNFRILDAALFFMALNISKGLEGEKGGLEEERGEAANREE